MTRFDDLWHAHRVAVLGYLIRRTDEPQDAADLLAETYAVVWRRLTSVPASPEDQPWIFGVAAKVLANHDRGARRRSRLESALRFEVRGLVVAPVDPAVLALRAALQDLEPLDRELLTLSAWEGLTANEIALVLDLTATAVSTRQCRARARLRAVLVDDPVVTLA